MNFNFEKFLKECLAYGMSLDHYRFTSRPNICNDEIYIMYLHRTSCIPLKDTKHIQNGIDILRNLFRIPQLYPIEWH